VGTLRPPAIRTFSRLSSRLCAFASKSGFSGVRFTAVHAVALLSAVLVAATAWSADSTLVIENTAIEKTLRCRPDLIHGRALSEHERQEIDEILKEIGE